MSFKCDCDWLALALKECKTIVLSKRDAERFEKQILNPPEDNEKLKKVTVEYLKAIDEGRLMVKD